MEGSHLHKGCFKCDHCNRQLTISNFAAVNGKNYCKTHYVELFKSSGGNYKVFGDAGFTKSASGHLTGIGAAAEAEGRARGASVREVHASAGRRASSSFNHVWSKKDKATSGTWDAKLEGTPTKKSDPAVPTHSLARALQAQSAKRPFRRGSAWLSRERR